MDPKIIELAKALSKEDRSTFQSEFRERKRNSGLGILFALLLGGFGVHQFYLGNNKRAIWYIVGNAISFLLSFIIIGLVGYIVIFVYCVKDALNMEKLVSKANMRIAQDLINEINAIRSLDEE